MTTQHIQTVIEELGALSDLDFVLESEDGCVWGLQADDDTMVFVEYGSDDRRLYLSAEVSTPVVAIRPELYGLLLEYNNCWRETGGIVMAIDEPDGAIVQCFDISAEGIDSTDLHQVLQHFLAKLRSWRDVIAELSCGCGAKGSPDADAADELPHHAPNMIRV